MGLNYVGFAWCYMEQEFVAATDDLDALKTQLAERVREMDSTPRVMVPAAEITQFSSGRPWRVLGGYLYDGLVLWGNWYEVTPNAVSRAAWA